MRVASAALLDACVLLPMPLADTLLRLAETPRLYTPRWSADIMAEVSRNLVSQLGKTPQQAAVREQALRQHFPEAWVAGYEPLVPRMSNHPKDRHVLAAAVKAGAKLLVTYNAKDFPEDALQPWGVKRQGPSTFLKNLYVQEPDSVVERLTAQAENVRLSMEALLEKLRVNVPGFVELFCTEQGIFLE